MSSWSCPSGASWRRPRRQDIEHMFWVKFSLCDCVSAGAAGKRAVRKEDLEWTSSSNFPSCFFQIA